jgi:hypothetical protein
MGNQPWLDDLRRQLIRRNLPRRYVQRVLEEAADHLEDLMEETMEKTEFNANARMGETQIVAAAALAAYRRRGFFGRHPVVAFLAFAVSPLLAFLILMQIGLLALSVICWSLGLVDNDGLHLGAVKAVINYVVPLAVIAVPSMLLAFFYCSLARRTVVGKKWMLVACGALVVISSATFCQLEFYGASDHGQLTLFFGVRYGIQIVQFFIAAAFSWWLIRRSEGREPYSAA